MAYSKEVVERFNAVTNNPEAHGVGRFDPNDPNVATTNNIDTMKNRNVRLALLFTFLGSASRGVWAFVILSNFIHVLTDSTLNVGIAEGIQGFSH